MLHKEELLNLNFYKKAIFTGSIHAMCFRIEKQEDTLLVTWWPGPYCYDKTPAEQKTSRAFPFAGESLQEIADYLNEAAAPYT